jgi:hypothetical protein
VLLLEVPTQQGPAELHLDVSTPQRPVLTAQCAAPTSELHLYVSTLPETCAAPGHILSTRAGAAPGLVYSKRPMLHLDMSTPQGPELHLDMVGQQEPMLLLDVQFLHYRGVSRTWTYFDCTGPIVHHNGAAIRVSQRSSSCGSGHIVQGQSVPVRHHTRGVRSQEFRSGTHW